jgi:ribosomal protein S18 acetylase RimI-like enzyme
VTLTVVALGPDDWESHRDLRLEALLTAPTAFAMTHADSLHRDEADWRASLTRVTHWQVRNGDRAVGMAGLWEQTDEQGGVTAHLVAMFVRPQDRRRGAGDLLLRTVVEAARSRGHERLHLHVETSNGGAVRIYERAGFRPDGPAEPHPHADGLSEQPMVLDWAPD